MKKILVLLCLLLLTSCGFEPSVNENNGDQNEVSNSVSQAVLSAKSEKTLPNGVSFFDILYYYDGKLIYIDDTENGTSFNRYDIATDSHFRS